MIFLFIIWLLPLLLFFLLIKNGTVRNMICFLWGSGFLPIIIIVILGKLGMGDWVGELGQISTSTEDWFINIISEIVQKGVLGAGILLLLAIIIVKKVLLMKYKVSFAEYISMYSIFIGGLILILGFFFYIIIKPLYLLIFGNKYADIVTLLITCCTFVAMIIAFGDKWINEIKDYYIYK
jgi:hypothetical protein